MGMIENSNISNLQKVNDLRDCSVVVLNLKSDSNLMETECVRNKITINDLTNY